MAHEKPSIGCGDDMDEDWLIPLQLQSIENLFMQAEKAFVEKNYNEALRIYGIILDKAKTTTDESPNSVYGFIKSLYMTARCHMEKGNYDEANCIGTTVSFLLLSNCPEKIHIPERLLIKIEERRGDFVKAFIKALTFKESHPSNKRSGEILSEIQIKLEHFLTTQNYDIQKETFAALMLKGKSFYESEEPSVAAAVFDKVIEMFKSILPGEDIQEACNWRDKCYSMVEEKLTSDVKTVDGQIGQRRQSNNRDTCTLQVNLGNVDSADIATTDKRNRKKKSKASLPEPIWQGLPPRISANPYEILQNLDSKSSHHPKSDESDAVLDYVQLSEKMVSVCEGATGSNVPSSGVPGSMTSTEEHEREEVPYETQGQGHFKLVENKKREKKKEEEKEETDLFILPKGVEVMCSHYLRQPGSTPKVCRGCESTAQYTYLNKLTNKWTPVRKLPSRIAKSVTQIRKCWDYLNGKDCRKVCTYAHGAESHVWELQHRGVLPSPENYLKNKAVQPTNPKKMKKRKKKTVATSVKNISTDSLQNLNSEVKQDKPKCQPQAQASTSTTSTLETRSEKTLVMEILNNTNKQRPLPDLAVMEDLRLCESVEKRIACSFGVCCKFAHSKEELDSWKKMYQERLTQSVQKCPINVTQKTIKHHDLKLTESIPGVELLWSPDNPNVKLGKNNASFEWEFRIRFKVDDENKLPGVNLQYHRHNFHLSRIKVIGFDESDNPKVLINENNMKTDCYQPHGIPESSTTRAIKFQVNVKFQASVPFGSFTQRILFNFGKDLLLMKEFNVDVGSKDTLEKLTDARQAVILEALPWDNRDMEIIRCGTNPEREKLNSTYSLPKEVEGIVSAQLVEGETREDTYKQTMHQLLFAEEVHMRNLLLRLTPKTVKVKANTFIYHELEGLMKAPGDHLFGLIDSIEITPDDMAGRVCVRNVQSVMILSPKANCLYEIPIISLESGKVILNLTPRVCRDLKITDGIVVDVCMRFKLNRRIPCMMHKAIDCLGETHARQLFPEKQCISSTNQVNIHLKELDPRLNESQRRVIQAIVEAVPTSPPLVVFGPFGTGKTFTLNQAVIYLMRKTTNHVLLCTHTNSAADIHVELLDEYLNKNGVMTHDANKPLRIYDPDVKVSKSSEKCRKYALIDNQTFLEPTTKNVIDHRVIITTLTTADLLTKFNVLHGIFTHILIDEAAQAWETEALIPIALAGPNTKIVFTGDHMQMNPEVFSEFAREKGLQKSLPVRLFDHYGRLKDPGLSKENVIFLSENYRSNEEILNFPSEICFGGKIIARGHKDNPSHPEMGSLIFYAARGQDEKQHDNTYLNVVEVHEIVKRVNELQDNWPVCWGEKNLQDIAVVAAYSFQVRAIREQLRAKGLGKVNVETIHNVQGKEFRALFISTVRTRNSIASTQNRDDLSLEFLSDPKLLITAVTRAKSLVAVVGDPVALCAIGDCRDLWTDYISRCSKKNKLFGITLEELKDEVKAQPSSITLNPEAPSFFPESQRYQNDVSLEIKESEATFNPLSMSASNSVVQEVDTFSSLNVPKVDLEDEIIKAFIKKCKERIDFEKEFPFLSKGSFTTTQNIGKSQPTRRNQLKTIDFELLRSEFMIRRINGREVISLLLDCHKKRSDQAEKVVLNSVQKNALDRKALMGMVEKEPSRYMTAQLQIGNDKFRTTYALVKDKEKPDIPVKGSIRQAFDRDTGVIDLESSPLAIEGNVGVFIGVLNHLIDPIERQYVCEVDYNNPSVMIPINKSVTRIMNVSHNSTRNNKEIPIYDKNENEQLVEVDMLKLEDVVKYRLLFVVQFLKWKKSCPLPLGMAIKTIPKGETLEQSRAILLNELGIRETFNGNTQEIIHYSIPTPWEIQNEIKVRRKIANAFTIDPKGAKDLDDAISVDGTEDGNFKIGIHIADVSFFVRRGSELDRAAQQRGVSFYPSEKAENIPMLPRELSERFCSLLPNQDRLTVSVFVTLNNSGEIVSEFDEILRTVTHSCCQLSYSRAQCIIDEEYQLGDPVPDKVCKDIRLLHTLVVKMRRLRLKQASFDHSDKKEDTEAHELIEELMILANHRVGSFLHDKKPRVAPFRTQLEPKVHRLNDWAANYGAFAKYSPSMQQQLESEDITDEVKERINSEENDISIKIKVWEQIYEAAKSRNHKRVESLICDPYSSPQFAVTRQNLMRIQCKSQYESSVINPKHHSLRLSNYVHFTSPIRRYIDIEVHRLLLTLIARNGSQEQKTLDEDEMSTLCRRSSHFQENSRKFEWESKRIQFASTLKTKNEVGVFAIDEIEERFFTIQPVSPDEDYFLGKHSTITFDDLSPTSKSENDNRKLETTLKWRFRMYLSPPPSKDNTSSPVSLSEEEMLVCLLRDAEEIKKMIATKHEIKVYEIDGGTWMKLIDAIKKSKTNELLQEVTDRGQKIKEIKSKEIIVKRRGNVNKTNHGENNVNDEGHFHVITMNLKQYDIIGVQLFSRLRHGIISPDAQFFEISSHFGICLEHRKNPRGCFSYNTRQVASKNTYASIKEYIQLWKPQLAMEAATGAVRQNDGFNLLSLSVQWSQVNDEIQGKFTLTESYCKSRQIKFHPRDLACVKILHSTLSTATNNTGTAIWIGHAIIKSCQLVAENKIFTIIVKIHQMACTFPLELLGAQQQTCDMEIIYQPLPLRRMNEALSYHLDKSSNLVKTICLGHSRELSKAMKSEAFLLPTEKLSLADCCNNSEFQPLNEYQEKAVRQALINDFSLIQGPPGTGKTVTGVHIAYWFAKRNGELQSMEPVDQEEKQEIEEKKGNSSKSIAPPQVLYCGPSNKSVDVVTEYLLRIPEMKDKVLRVHGSLIQESEYPIPNKIRISKPTVSEDELKIPGEKVKKVSLHHFIRSEESPYAKDLRKMEEQFKKAKKRGERPSDKEVAQYCELIDVAEKWAIQETGKEIILCTCSRAGSRTITKGCNNIQQCIIDESGMCMEPEILVPMTSSNAKQFVLIGDHKQLQPIVLDKLARNQGLQRSTFERLADRATMLRIQYRMHPSICEFPSNQFYKGQLETPDSVRLRKTAQVKWPANDQNEKIVFCHMEGEEKSSVIVTAESGVESKYNKEEAQKAVQVAKYLVDNHPSIKKKNVVILTPYRQQRKEIQDLLRGAYDEILVTTIIKSQGSEWDYVILSLVRSLPEADLEPEPSSLWLGEHLGFVTDDHQINVALTRAKNGLCIIGNKKLLAYSPTWRELIDQYERNHCVIDEKNGVEKWPPANDD